jgi:hypothetical protein
MSLTGPDRPSASTQNVVRGLARSAVQQPGEAEVGKPGAAVSTEEDIARLEVPVNDPLLVDVMHGLGQRLHPFSRPAWLGAHLGDGRELSHG